MAGNKQTEEMRIVLVGKTGAGKSAAGNIILGFDAFESKFSSKSLTSECKKVTGGLDDQRVAVIDTPGLFDTTYSKEMITKKIVHCIKLSSPGPHVFLIVIKLGRFTEEEQKTVQMIQKIFGEAASKYTMVLFTHGDNLEGVTINDFIDESEDLKNFVVQCNNQYHVFNKKDKDRSQVGELLKKINSMVEKNGGSFYTSEMFQEVERAIEEEKERILRENEEKNRKEREDLKKQWEGERLKEEQEKLMKEQERKARESAENVNVRAGAELGAKLGSFAGPIGAALGAALGAGVGAAIDACSLQ
ncbi:hypothetical protein UPYG_G00047110 [Umbra pygmaea]|uniref:AIG1-type G domain-containing protein n=1 Tax=Umbra pygmaea TaxID=75934 RepID=A0ABD0XR86_UMBPY